MPSEIESKEDPSPEKVENSDAVQYKMDLAVISYFLLSFPYMYSFNILFSSIFSIPEWLLIDLVQKAMSLPDKEEADWPEDFATVELKTEVLDDENGDLAVKFWFSLSFVFDK